MSIDTLRPANELQEADFRGSGVWRFVTPDEMEHFGVDESYVVQESGSPGAGQYGSYILAARYELRSGQVLPGVVDVAILNAHLEFTPSIIFAAGKSVDPLGRETEGRLQRLLKISNAQPVRWQLERPLAGEADLRAGSIGRPGISQALRLLRQLVRLKLLR